MVSAHDERLSFTYAEFPLESFRELVDLAHQYTTNTTTANHSTLVDLGSGCGRLVLYASLSLHNWRVQGVEISPLLHDYAVQSLTRGVREGLFLDKNNNNNTQAQLHLGPVEPHTNALRNTSILFAYCTVWPTAGFSEALGAMILDSSWSRMLAEQCVDGCVVITTDRALDPKHGWVLLDRRDVSNPDVFGSTGYVQVLRK